MADRKIDGNGVAGNVQALDYDRRQVAHLQAVVDRLNAVIDKHNTDCEDLRAQLAAANARADQAEYRIVHIAAGLFPGGFDNNVAAIRDALRAKPAPAVTVQDSFAGLIADARTEAEKAMKKFPQPNYVLLKVAEEAGEVVKAGVHFAEGRETRENVKSEMIQTIAMLYRLWVEGDQVNGVPPIAPPEA